MVYWITRNSFSQIWANELAECRIGLHFQKELKYWRWNADVHNSKRLHSLSFWSNELKWSVFSWTKRVVNGSTIPLSSTEPVFLHKTTFDGWLYCHGKCCKFILFNSFHKALLSLKIKAHLSLENINREKFWALFHHTEMTFRQKPGISSENHLSNQLVLLSFVTENWNIR